MVLHRTDFKNLETTINADRNYLESIIKGIAEGISEGLRKGAAKGFKKGIWDGVKECSTRGLINIGTDNIGDILMDIPEDIIKTSVREGARQIIDISVKKYVDRICNRLSERIRNENLRVSEDQINSILNLMKRSGQEMMRNITKKLPSNPFLREITSGLQVALEESLENTFQEQQAGIGRAAEDNSGG